MRTEISAAPLDPRVCENDVLTAADGAVVTFTGVVRDHDGGQAVTALTYHAHPKAARFLAEICARWDAPSIRISAVHRIGDLTIGELAIVVAVAAPHRAEAFQVCAELVVAIKSGVPIWKRQHFADGSSEWVDPTDAL